MTTRGGTMDWKIVEGDCIEAMRSMPAASVDAVVCDPPYHLSFMGRAWDTASPAESQRQHQAWATEALRVLKPGGHLLAFGGTRTYHRLTCGIEDAGFEIRDCIAWMYGSGFPKSLDVSKALDKAAGVEREQTGREPRLVTPRAMAPGGAGRSVDPGARFDRPATPDAERWAGWGTALKPAHEPIVVARKPPNGTVAANVLQHGTGALNVDGCRVGTDAQHKAKCESVVGLGSNRNGVAYGAWEGERQSSWSPAGRWPANVTLDPEAAAVLDRQTGEVGGGTGASTRGGGRSREWNPTDREAGRGQTIRGGGEAIGFGDAGGASRFFYVAKASSAERSAGLSLDTIASHPTVKPIALMRWLVRLVTPSGGTVLDPFAGSGTTGIAVGLEGFNFVGIEREPEYAAIARARIGWWAAHPDGMLLVDRLGAEQAQRDTAEAGQLSIEGWMT